MAVFPLSLQPHRQAAQLPPYLDGAFMTHLSGGGVEGARLDFDDDAVGSPIRRATVPVRDIRGPLAGGGTGQVAVLELTDQLTCNLDAANGLGSIDAGPKQNQTAYELRAYADLSGGTVGLMANETGSPLTIPAGVVWQSPCLAALITDDAGACKAFDNVRRGWQQWTETVQLDGEDYRGALVLQLANASNQGCDLVSSNGGLDPAAVTAVHEVRGLLRQTRDYNNTNQFAAKYGDGTGFAILLDTYPDFGLAVTDITSKLWTATFAAGLAPGAAPHMRFDAIGIAAAGDVIVQALRFGW